MLNRSGRALGVVPHHRLTHELGAGAVGITADRARLVGGVVSHAHGQLRIGTREIPGAQHVVGVVGGIHGAARGIHNLRDVIIRVRAPRLSLNTPQACL